MWKKAYEDKQREERRKAAGYGYSSGTFIGTVGFGNGVELYLEYKSTDGGYVSVSYSASSSRKVGFMEDQAPYRRAVENAVRAFADRQGIRMPSIIYPFS